jgi:hypothetical protein
VTRGNPALGGHRQTNIDRGSIHRGRSEGRRQSRQAIQDIAERLADLPSREAVNDFLRDKRASIEDAIRGQKEAMQELGVKTAWNLLRLSGPSGVTAAAIRVGLPPEVVGPVGAAALSVGLLDWYTSRRRGRRELEQSCPWHYLVTLEGNLSEDPIRDFSKGMAELIHD